MLQIFNGQNACQNTCGKDSSAHVPVMNVIIGGPVDQRATTTTTKPGILVHQLHAETERRFFLEEAIGLIDVRGETDSSSLLNVLNLLNRIAGTRQTLIASGEGAVVASTFCSGQAEAELSISAIKNLVDRAIQERQQHGNRQKVSIARPAMDREALTLELPDCDVTDRWLVAIGDLNQRGLKEQRQLFQTASRLLGRLLTVGG